MQNENFWSLGVGMSVNDVRCNIFPKLLFIRDVTICVGVE
jgi:hypothetical protein